MFKGKSCQIYDKTVNREAIMKRSKLRNEFLKERNNASQIAYRKQRNLYETLLQKFKKQYLSNLEQKLITDKKRLEIIQTTLF